MKWKVNRPKLGETRFVRKFAWFPTLVEDCKVWLETYETKEVYRGINSGWEEYVEFVHEDHTWVATYTARKLLYNHV